MPTSRAPRTLPRRPPWVIAHRGASALRPEHTLAAYERAIDDGADFIEPDLVMSADGVLIARHENEIGSTTDVARHPRFASRRRAGSVDGMHMLGWFCEDFTLAELRTLHARERLPEVRSTHFDGRFSIPTLAEIIDLLARKAAETGRPLGLIPEIKHPTHFQHLGLGMEAPLLKMLHAHPYTCRAPVEIQSFEVGNLRRLRAMLDADHIENITLLQLLGEPDECPFDHAQDAQPLRYGTLMQPGGLAEVARYADAIGPGLDSLRAPDDAGRRGEASPLIADAHAVGLEVHAWTFRPENRFLPPEHRGPGDINARCDAGAIAEITRFLDDGLDGFFTDDPALGRQAVDTWLQRDRP
ncbi:glycerophosphodiester phosphodiesterase [Oleiagrimonas sp. C23AA]|nr:glycerophosphodiester phosphodiesterase [Oleiagrimonas sp. C23AA]